MYFCYLHSSPLENRRGPCIILKRHFFDQVVLDKMIFKYAQNIYDISLLAPCIDQINWIYINDALVVRV